MALPGAVKISQRSQAVIQNPGMPDLLGIKTKMPFKKGLFSQNKRL